MHEMGIALEIVKIATAAIPDNTTSAQVERVNLRIVKLSSVIPDSLRFCFEIATMNTPLSSAELSIEVVPIRGRCRLCNTEWTFTEPAFFCKKCNNSAVDIISGRELDIISIEIPASE